MSEFWLLVALLVGSVPLIALAIGWIVSRRRHDRWDWLWWWLFGDSFKLVLLLAVAIVGAVTWFMFQ